MNARYRIYAKYYDARPRRIDCFNRKSLLEVIGGIIEDKDSNDLRVEIEPIGEQDVLPIERRWGV